MKKKFPKAAVDVSAANHSHSIQLREEMALDHLFHHDV